MNEKLKHNLRFALPLFLAGFTLCTFGELAQLYNEKQLFVLTDNNQISLADFNSFYNAALLSRDYHQHGTPVYDFDIQSRSLETVTAPVKPDPTMLSVYPPHFFLILEPLAGMGIYPAWLVLSGFIALAIGLSLYLVDLPAIKEKYDRLCCCIALIGSSPTFSNFRLGQNSFFLLAGMLVVWRLMEKRKYFFAGLSTILCMFKPQYLPVLCTAGLIVGRVPFVLGAMVAGLIVGSISYLSYGWENLKAWPALMKLGETHPDVAHAMQSIRGQITIMLGGHADTIGTPFLILILGSAIAFTAWIWWRYRKQLEDIYLFRMVAALSVMAAIFGSPHTHVQDYVLFFGISGIWIWSYIQKYVSAGKEMALKLLLVCFPFVSWVFLVLDGLFHIFRLQPFFLYAVAIFILSLRLLLKTGAK